MAENTIVTDKKNFTITNLRKDVLSILRKAGKPLKAYEILEILKLKRPNAQPPTVYRVLDFLKDWNVVHQIKNNHTYTLCQLANDTTDQPEHEMGVIFICQKCQHIDEVTDPVLSVLINQLSKQNNFQFSESTIEFSGLCDHCQ